MAPPLLLLLLVLAASRRATAQVVAVSKAAPFTPAHAPRRSLRQAPPPHYTWPPPASSAFFPYDCAPHASNTSLLLAALADGPGGGDAAATTAATAPQPVADFPAWITHLCPEVVAHFTAFPYFPAFHRLLPVSTTLYAAAGVCTLKVAAALAEEEAAGAFPPTSIPTTRLTLHAGSHLGALLHGGPIPWDDDIDAALPWGARGAFLARCAAARHALHPTVSLECRVTGGAIKVFVRPRRSGGGGGGGGGSGSGGDDAAGSDTGPAFSTPTPLGWAAPFVDLFLYKLVGGRLVEVAADSGSPSAQKSWRVGQALPPRPVYFGGLVLPAPPVALAAARYDLAACVTAPYDHRHEEWVPQAGRALRLDCCALAAAGFPFVVGGGGAAVLVAGGAGGGEVRALDLRRRRETAGRGGYRRQAVPPPLPTTTTTTTLKPCPSSSSPALGRRRRLHSAAVPACAPPPPQPQQPSTPR